MRVEEVIAKVTRLLLRMCVAVDTDEKKEKSEERHVCRPLAKRRPHPTSAKLNFASFSHLCLAQTIDLRAMSISGERLALKIKAIV